MSVRISEARGGGEKADGGEGDVYVVTHSYVASTSVGLRANAGTRRCQWPLAKCECDGSLNTPLWPAAGSSGDVGGPTCAGCGSSRQMHALRECATWARLTRGWGPAE